MTAVDDRLLALAEDVGRLRRRVDAGTYLGFIASRIAGHVDALDAMLTPCAAELVYAAATIQEALDETDERATTLRRLLGDDTAGAEQNWARA